MWKLIVIIKFVNEIVWFSYFNSNIQKSWLFNVCSQHLHAFLNDLC